MGLFDKILGHNKYELPTGSTKWQAQRQAFYREQFGEFEPYHEVMVAEPVIHIYMFKPDEQRNRDFYTLVTDGMSDLPMILPGGVPKEYRRAELLMYVDKTDAETQLSKEDGRLWQAQWLKSIAAMPHQHNMWFGPGLTFGNEGSGVPIAPGSLLNNVFLIKPEHESAEVQAGMKLGRGRAMFSWVVPITEAEKNYKVEHGTNALVQLLRDNNHPRVLDVTRPSYV